MEVKAWGGISAVAVAILWALVLGYLYLNSTLQQGLMTRIVNCEVSGADESNACQSLPELGVDPKMLLSDEEYRNHVKVIVNKRLEGSSRLASHLAEYTLKHVGSTGVKLSVQAMEDFEKLSNRR